MTAKPIHWPWVQSVAEVAHLVATLKTEASTFFDRARTLKEVLARGNVAELGQTFGSNVDITLALAQGAQTLELHQVAADLAKHGLSMTGKLPASLIPKFQKVIDACARPAATPR